MTEPKPETSTAAALVGFGAAVVAAALSRHAQSKGKRRPEPAASAAPAPTPAELLAARVRARREAGQLPRSGSDPVLAVAAAYGQSLTATVAHRASEALAYLVPYSGPEPKGPESYARWLGQICREMVIPNWQQGLNLVPIKEAAILYDEVVTAARAGRLTVDEATRLVGETLQRLDVVRRWQAPSPRQPAAYSPGFANAAFQQQHIFQWAMANPGGWAVPMPGGGIWTVGGTS